MKREQELDALKGAMSKTSFTLDDTQLPDIEDWEKDGEYTLEVKVKMTGKHDTTDGVSGDFDIVEVSLYNDEEEGDGE